MASIQIRIKPPSLRRGDKVAVVAPASNINRDALEKGCDGLRKLGYEPVFSESILERDLYFAGSIQRRARELEEMFLREDVRAIICARGGYGSNYLLPGLNPAALNLKTILDHPKIFAAHSDLTSLLTTFTDTLNLVTFHTPMVNKDFAAEDGVDLASWHSAVEGSNEWEIGAGSGARPLVAGEAEGTLYGGCLSILVAAIGTHYDIQTAGKILFLEDVAAKPFQIDRMLMQMKLAGKFKGVRGIVFGEMLDCVQNSTQDYTLEDVVMRVVGDLGIPVAFGMRSGHVTRANITLPFGVTARLEVSGDVKLKILEAATAG